jgi:hypothetical protein
MRLVAGRARGVWVNGHAGGDVGALSAGQVVAHRRWHQWPTWAVVQLGAKAASWVHGSLRGSASHARRNSGRDQYRSLCPG